jgi:cyclic dehypoxanthinyl futalosine synthase
LKTEQLLEKALQFDFLSVEEGLFLYEQASLSVLMLVANELRKKKKNHNKVGWIIDRNVNITNVCISGCKFCNYYRSLRSKEAYITTTDQYKEKIEELFRKGGNQVLLQGGLHPELGLSFYCDLFKELKNQFPNLKLHALGPAEIVHISNLENITYRKTLTQLIKAGLDSLPGAGAEILADRVRKEISPAKCSAGQWLDVMREAHQLNMITSATMMFGHIETKKERIEHLVALREVQSEKPLNSPGFVTFIPWPFQDKNTYLQTKYGIENQISQGEYIRTIAISRIMLANIENIQASWLTVGIPTAQICLHAGANDLGSIMIEENVVSSAGASYKIDSEGIQKAIVEAGFVPQFRDQGYQAKEYFLE